MHRLWVGLDPHIVLSCVGSFVTGCVLVLHLWAFGQFNWPATLKATYATPAATR